MLFVLSVWTVLCVEEKQKRALHKPLWCSCADGLQGRRPSANPDFLWLVGLKVLYPAVILQVYIQVQYLCIYLMGLLKTLHDSEDECYWSKGWISSYPWAQWWQIFWKHCRHFWDGLCQQREVGDFTSSDSRSVQLQLAASGIIKPSAFNGWRSCKHLQGGKNNLL